MNNMNNYTVRVFTGDDTYIYTTASESEANAFYKIRKIFSLTYPEKSIEYIKVTATA